jgi:hypothetical protein
MSQFTVTLLLNCSLSNCPKRLNFSLLFWEALRLIQNLTQLTGVVFLGVSLFAFYKKYYLQNPFVFLCILYSVMMAAMTTFKRYEYGMNTALSERYSIYSMLLTAGILILTRDLFSRPVLIKKILFPALLLLSVLINLKYFTFHLRHPDDRKEGLMSKMENYHLNNSGFNCLEVNTLNKLAKNGFYNYQLDMPLHNKTFYDSLNRPPLKYLKLHIDTIYQTHENLHITGTIANPPVDVQKIGQVHHRLWAIHNNAVPFDCTHNEITEPKNDKTLILDMELENEHHKVSLPNFSITVPKKHFLKGQYAIYLLLVNDNPVNYPPVKSNIVFHL